MKIELSLVADADLGPLEGIAHYPEERNSRGKSLGPSKYPQANQVRIDEVIAEVVARAEAALGREGLSLRVHHAVVHVDDEMAAAKKE